MLSYVGIVPAAWDEKESPAALADVLFEDEDQGDWRPPGRQDAGAPSASLRDEEHGRRRWRPGAISSTDF